MAKVALVHNLIQSHMLRDGPLDRVAEYDSEETISALSVALRAGDHEVIALEADESIVEKLKSAHVQVVFNSQASPHAEDTRHVCYPFTYQPCLGLVEIPTHSKV